ARVIVSAEGPREIQVQERLRGAHSEVGGEVEWFLVPAYATYPDGVPLCYAVEVVEEPASVDPRLPPRPRPELRDRRADDPVHVELAHHEFDGGRHVDDDG